MKTIELYFQKSLVLLLFFFFGYTAFSQTTTLKKIKGKITSFNEPLKDVNIIVIGKNRGTKTDIQGSYSIEAEVGDKIQYSYVGFNTIIILIEDITSILNLEMVANTNNLDEVIVKGRTSGKVLKQAKKAEVKFKTAMGIINPRASGYSIGFIDGKDINLASNTLKDALNGKVSGRLPSTWDVDGQLFTEEPPIDLSNIKDIHILKRVGSTIRYGSFGRNGVIVIRTKNGSFDDNDTKKKIASQYTNKNFYDNDAKKLTTQNVFASTIQDQENSTKQIKGKITFLNEPLPDVNITIKGKNQGTRTDEQGNYTLEAETGDMLQYSHIGFRTISLLVEDITTVLNLEMIPKENKLDEVVVKGSVKGKTLEQAQKAEKEFTTARGKVNPKRAGYAVSFVEGDAISSIYSSLSEALVGKVPGARIETTTGKFILKEATSINYVPDVLWEVDGVIYNREPDLDLSQIKSVHVLKSLAATNRYGTLGNGGVVVVETKQGSFDPIAAKRHKIAQQYQNKQTYANDAIAVNQVFDNTYTQTIAAFANKQQAYNYYQQTLKNQLKDYVTHISIAQKFSTYYKDNSLTVQILTNISNAYPKNPEIQKAIAYQFQALGKKKEAISIYEQIYKLRPGYAQSYRDLANAYRENDQYQRAWRLYMTYLLKGNDVSGEGIGQLLYNEMEWLYFNRKNQAQIKERFVPKSESINDFRNDVRLVFEWNTSEAEFDLEFVNPQQQVYTFEHSLAKNQDLITDEKQKGYSSKEFIIDDLKDGQWLVNITYQGNKKPEPTYLKVTQYYNWGKPNQHEKTSVYQFKDEREKIQLFTLNKQVLMVKN